MLIDRADNTASECPCRFRYRTPFSALASPDPLHPVPLCDINQPASGRRNPLGDLSPHPAPGHAKNYCKPQTIATLAEPRSGPTMIGPWTGDDASRAVKKDAFRRRTSRRSAIGAGYVATVICRVSAAIRVQDDRPSRQQRRARSLWYVGSIRGIATRTRSRPAEGRVLLISPP